MLTVPEEFLLTLSALPQKTRNSFTFRESRLNRVVESSASKFLAVGIF